MHLTLTLRCTDNFSGYLINYDLRLESMLFLLTAKEVFLFFLGRSIGVSVTSITTTSIALSV